MKHGKAREIGPSSRTNSLAKLDGRTREAALMRRVRADLTAHVGGNPTFPQSLLIERCAVLALRLAQIDRAILAGETLSLHDNNHAIAWHNCLRRTITALGPPAPVDAPVDPMAALRQHLAARRRASVSEAA